MKYTFKVPHTDCHDIYADMLTQHHMLIAGQTGSGKSVLIDSIIHTALLKNPRRVQFILIDPKKVDLIDYKDMPHTLTYADETNDILAALQEALNIIDMRYDAMQKKRIKEYEGSDIYVIIDELADLMTTVRKQAEPMIQRICQIGRACKVHCIAATQCPLASIISTPIKVNMTAIVGLKTRNARDSYNIIGMSGCETLPPHGTAWYITPKGDKLVKLPMYSDSEREKVLAHWSRPAYMWMRVSA